MHRDRGPQRDGGLTPRVMRLARRWCMLLLLFGNSASGQAPLFARLSTMQHPRGQDWQQLDGAWFTIIHPKALGTEAGRALDLLERHYRPLSHSLGTFPRRIPVVLNNQSTTPNAYVAWAPRRSQWYPSQGTTVDAFGPVEWYRLLALHEGRHIVQEQALRTGWVGFFSRLLGDYTMAFLGGSLYFPSWFWEGDAVGMETALSSAGRGRQPQFTARTRALMAVDRPYGYYQAWLGSYRTQLPDSYEQGYLLTSYVRRHYGDSAWRRVTRRASWNPIPPMAMSMALKRETGQSLVRIHRAALAEAASEWKAQREARLPSGTPLAASGTGEYVEWGLPQLADDGSTIASYRDLDTPTQLVRIVNGRREVLVKRIGLVGDLQFHVRGQQVVWAEYEVDPRYGERSWLVIKRLDLGTRRVTRLTSRTRYSGPSLSPDGAEIAVVELDEQRRTRVVVLDAATGAVRRALSHGDLGYLVTPSWSADGKSVLVVGVDTARGNALWRVNTNDGHASIVMEHTHDAISRPMATGTHIVFGSPRIGFDDLWAFDTVSRSISLVTARPFGAMHPSPSPDGRQLLFADLGPAGWNVASIAFNPATFVANPGGGIVQLADSGIAQEARLRERDAGATIERTVATRPYRGLRTLFDFHSLMLAPASGGPNQGIAIESRNLLNTFGVSAGVLWNTNEGKMSYDVGASYAGLPMIFDAGVRLGSRGSTYTDTLRREREYSWNERSVTFAARLPLTRLMGQRRQSLVLSAAVSQTEITDQPVAFRFDNNNGRFMPVSYGIAASHVRAAAYRDLFQTGVSAAAMYRHTPFGSEYDSHLSVVRGAAIAPGLFDNHAFVVDAGHEEQRPTNYRFSSELVFPRGFARRFHERLTRASASYHLPLLYPDLALGPWLYVRRVQGSAFADAARGTDRFGARVADYRSAGGELTADIAPFGMRTTLRAGVRVAQRLTGDKRATTEFIVILPQ